MYINEIPQGSIAWIKARSESKKLEFKTEVIGPLQDVPGIPTALKICPIMKANKIVNFDLKGLVCDVILVHEQDLTPYEWRGVKIRMMKEDELCHVILTQKEANAINRRDNYRIWLGTDGLAQFAGSFKEEDVIVKDISASGISFIARSKQKVVSLGTPLHLEFADTEKKANFELGAKIVHFQQLEEDKILYGCCFQQESNEVRKYVNEKQIERARLAKSVSLRERKQA